MTNLKAKLNGKKGFTLIEMLVVIAIIAVLVAIIIPTVSSATSKAAAATNAANLRSLKAEIVTAILANDTDKITKNDSGEITAISISTPAMKEIKDGCKKNDSTNATITIAATAPAAANNSDFTLVISGNEYTLYYSGRTINNYANYADVGSFAASNPNPNPNPDPNPNPNPDE